MSSPLNVCQYWLEHEPGRCSYWDSTKTACKNSNASYYPACNLVGTQYKCSHYNGHGEDPICVLPDPNRHVVNRDTGSKWASPPSITGNTVQNGDVSAITGYNGGACDGYGTQGICSAYSPQHMGFSSLDPDDIAGSKEYDKEGFTSVSGEGMQFRLPLGYEVYNKRAQLGRCYWWSEDNIDFTVDETTGLVKPIDFHCDMIAEDAMVTNYRGFKWEYTVGMYRAPCNGCKPECPHYTGICWEYCVDDKMRHGDKVLAEQILEVRYYTKKDKWESVDYYGSFVEPDIQAWDGSLVYRSLLDGNVKGEIGAITTVISDFDVFTVKHSQAVLTEGVQAEDYRGNYPTLVRELKDMTLAPLIRNKFDQYGNENIFEVTDLYHEDVLIFGDTFWIGSTTYAINLSDPEMAFLPVELNIYNNMSEIESRFSDTEGFQDFKNNLDCVLDFVLNYMPEKMTISSFGSRENLFYINVPTVWDNNTVIVLNKGSGRWEFDKISFNKIFCGGVIGQTNFTVTGQGEVDYLPAYDSDFTSYVNDNGVLEFEFFPMISNYRGDTSITHYVYNDSIRLRLAADFLNPPTFDTYNMSYKLFKITAYEDVNLDVYNVRFFGNSGHAIVDIPDKLQILSNVIKPWGVEDKIKINYSNGSYCEMEIYDQETNLDRLEVNQVIIKPKDMKDFKMVCKDSIISFGNIYVYERRSFGEVPEYVDEDNNLLPYEVVKEDFIGEADVVDYRDYNDVVVTKQGCSFKLEKFGYESLTIAVVFKGITGRVKGHMKTKMITYVRQPFCRDVEIKYTWGSIYEKKLLIPEFNCYGLIDEKVVTSSLIKYYTPPCGDHDLSFFSGLGPMWYPYTDCESSARYNIVGVSEFDISIMEVFTDTSIDPPHGSHDIRMMGPSNKYGETCGTHAHLWDCLCDWSLCNYVKKNLDDGEAKNYFAGYARYRGGLSDVDKVLCARNYGTLPKFGNTYRDFLRSYRSMDNIDYYYWTGYTYVRLQKWTPMYEYYTEANITKPTSNYLFKLYCSNDFEDDGSSFVHPMGMMLVEGRLEDIVINEKIDVDNKNKPNRYRFEDVFRIHSTAAGIYYPYFKEPQQVDSGGGLVDMLGWYTYKDYPGSAGPPTKYSTQWAWQEIWKDLERYVIDRLSVDNYLYCATNSYKLCHKIPNNEDIIIAKPSSPYLFNEFGDLLEGRHLFLDIYHPNYRYDYRLEEHRLVCDEGTHEIIIDPPEVDDDGEYEIPFWTVSIDSGPGRCFDVDGEWEPDPEPTSGECYAYRSLYETCTEAPWVTDVILFAPGYIDKSTSGAEADGRYITEYDVIGMPVKTYYQRGLNVFIDDTKLDLLPRSLNLYESYNYEVKFDKTPDVQFENMFSNWNDLETSEWYEATYCFDIGYTIDFGDDLNVYFKFKIRPESGAAEDLDSVKMSIGTVKMSFEFGSESISTDDNEDYRLYHVPGVIIYKGVTESNFVEVHSCDSMVVSSTKDILESTEFIYEFNNAPEDILDGYAYYKISLRLNLTSEEMNQASDDYYLYTNVVKLNSIRLYYDKLEQGVETIKTHERLYNISYGQHGDFPPHGYDSTGSLLYPVPTDNSSVYQYDSIGGMVGMTGTSNNHKTMNKCRGRIMKACHPDKEVVKSSGGSNTSLYDWEDEQKKIYDKIAVDAGSVEFKMKSVTPPGLQDTLDIVGVQFPTWLCDFKNTLVRPLKEVKAYDQYSSCGHEFYHDFINLTLKYACGRHGSVFGRTVANVFEYSYVNSCSEEAAGFDVMDVLVAFKERSAKLFKRLLSASMGDSIRDDVQDRINQHTQEYDTMTFPAAIKPLN